MIYKKRYPFKIGCTSYVIPDSIVPNVQLMSEIVDDIELLFFELSKSGMYLEKTEKNELERIAKLNDVTYSVHCPIDKKIIGCTKEVLAEYAEEIVSIVYETSSLPVSGYNVHLDGITFKSTSEEISEWKENALFICKSIGSKIDETHLICIENLGYDADLNVELVENNGFSYCLDIGHLWNAGQAPAIVCNKMVEKCRIMHLHAVNGNKDHKSLKVMDREILNKFAQIILSGYTNVLTLELFNKEATFESLETIEDIWAKLHS